MSKKSPNAPHQKPERQRRNPQHSRSWWLKHYQAWQKSGLRKTDYCTRQGLSLSTFVNWTTRFKVEASRDEVDLSSPPVFFKATPVSTSVKPGLARTLTLGDISITFEQPIDSESLPDWIEALKRC
ncbi:MAG: hypothetical protein PVJ68_12590 [Candidatus Thiodiazotropha sp.]|jgi:hypothetical protein